MENKHTLNANTNNICILLSAGNSTRFCSDIPKQLFIYKNKHLINYSVEAIENNVNLIIIISNSKNYKKLFEIFKSNNKIVIIINDIDSRLKSIECGFNYIEQNIKLKKLKNINKIIIHDSARPFIESIHIQKIINETKYYSQYCLKLTNGLIVNKTLACLNRDNYSELCTPLCIDYELGIYIFKYIMLPNNIFEFIDVLRIYNIPIKLLYEEYKILKKITYISDI